MQNNSKNQLRTKSKTQKKEQLSQKNQNRRSVSPSMEFERKEKLQEDFKDDLSRFNLGKGLTITDLKGLGNDIGSDHYKSMLIIRQSMPELNKKASDLDDDSDLPMFAKNSMAYSVKTKDSQKQKQSKSELLGES